MEKTLDQTVKGTHTLKTKELVIEASDKFQIKVGDATFTMEPPGYHMHLWQPDAGLITHTAFIGEFSKKLSVRWTTGDRRVLDLPQS